MENETYPIHKVERYPNIQAIDLMLRALIEFQSVVYISNKDNIMKRVLGVL